MSQRESEEVKMLAGSVALRPQKPQVQQGQEPVTSTSTFMQLLSSARGEDDSDPALTGSQTHARCLHCMPPSWLVCCRKDKGKQSSLKKKKEALQSSKDSKANGGELDGSNEIVVCSADFVACLVFAVWVFSLHTVL